MEEYGWVIYEFKESETKTQVEAVVTLFSGKMKERSLSHDVYANFLEGVVRWMYQKNFLTEIRVIRLFLC